MVRNVEVRSRGALVAFRRCCCFPGLLVRLGLPAVGLLLVHAPPTGLRRCCRRLPALHAMRPRMCATSIPTSVAAADAAQCRDGSSCISAAAAAFIKLLTCSSSLCRALHLSLRQTRLAIGDELHCTFDLIPDVDGLSSAARSLCQDRHSSTPATAAPMQMSTPELAAGAPLHTQLWICSFADQHHERSIMRGPSTCPCWQFWKVAYIATPAKYNVVCKSPQRNIASVYSHDCTSPLAAVGCLRSLTWQQIYHVRVLTACSTSPMHDQASVQCKVGGSADHEVLELGTQCSAHVREDLMPPVSR
jgi:hypothetical protein